MLQKSRNNQRSTQRKYLGSEKNYNNPFFEAKKKRTQKNKSGFEFSFTKKRYIFFIFIFIFLGSFWFVYYSSYFTIKQIDARGQGRLDSTLITQLAWDQIKDSNFILWQQKNVFIFKEEELIESLNLKYSFNDIIVTKKLPSKLIIQYNEKEHSMIWLEKGIYYYADRQGYIIERLGNENENKDYPIIENTSDFLIANSKVSIDQELIRFSFLLNEIFKKYNDFKIDKFLIESNSTTLKIVLIDGPQLYFNIASDLEKQINKVLTLKNEILIDDFATKEYIDVRIGDRVYHR